MNKTGNSDIDLHLLIWKQKNVLIKKKNIDNRRRVFSFTMHFNIKFYL